MIAWAGAGIVEPLRLLFTAMWTSNTTPEHMTDVLVKYIPKHSRPSLEISEYRPISLISCLGKLYTMVWLPSLTDKLQPHITKHQGAFQKGTGALEQAWLATQLLQERREQGIETHAALTDLEKCYDTVWREGLYFLLYSYGVQGDMLRNIKRWIENTRAIPEWNGTVGKGVTPREGLKQGCCLSPILCAAFMNAFTADEPQGECHSSLVSLRQRAFRKGIQGKDWGIQSAFLEGKIACLQFVDDTTLFAHSKQEMVALFEQYSSFCRSYRINVNWSKCSVTVFCEQDAEELAAEKARLKEATAQRASAPRKQTKAKSLRLAVEAREQSQPVYMTVQGQGIREKESFRILGVHLRKGYGPAGAKAHALSKVAEYTVPAAWVRDHMGKAESMKYCRAKALPSALFGGGIPNGDCAWATPVGHALYRVALGYEQSPGKGQKAAPNLAVEEQSGAPTWAAELAVANASLSNRLLSSKGPKTWPRLFAKAKLARGESLGLQMPKHPQSSNKAGKKLKARKAAALVAAQSHRASRTAAASLSESSNRRLYCSLTKGLIPQVCGQKSQSFLERQVVGPVSFSPLVWPDSCTWHKIPRGGISPMPRSWHGRFARQGLGHCQCLRPAPYCN